MSPELADFAAALVREVRDRAIQACDFTLQHTSPKGRRWQEAASLGTEELAKLLVPECIDEAIFQLLHSIDDGRFQLTFTSRDGTRFDLAEEGLGELAGWYVGEWRAKYSRERFVDYLAGLAEDLAKKVGTPPEKTDPDRG